MKKQIGIGDVVIPRFEGPQRTEIQVGCIKPIYRLEHKDTGLGPFSHHNQISEVINKGIHSNNNAMADIPSDIIENLIERYGDIRFGYGCLESFNKMIKSWDVLNYYGFVLRVIEKPILFHNFSDNQVIFCL